RLFLVAPADSFVAPPGYYLLFLTGSADGSDVPSIAKWMSIDYPGGADGADVADVVPPDPIVTLAGEILSNVSVDLSWTATADDAQLAASGREQSFALRYSYLGPVNTQNGWGYASSATGEPTPGPVGTDHYMTVGNLSSNTWYHFGTRAID